jgi:hypothetical protein
MNTVLDDGDGLSDLEVIHILFIVELVSEL